jgi:hypothetical protein
MATFTVLQNKLLFDLIPAYTRNIHNSKDLADLKASTRVAFDTIIDELFPGEVMSIRPRKQDPQEVNKEESKEGINLVSEVAAACQDFLNDQKVIDGECDKQVVNITKQKAALLESQQQLGHLKAACEGGFNIAIE